MRVAACGNIVPYLHPFSRDSLSFMFKEVFWYLESFHFDTIFSAFLTSFDDLWSI